MTGVNKGISMHIVKDSRIGGGAIHRDFACVLLNLMLCLKWGINFLLKTGN